jgi:hypothetical protein
MAKKRVFFDECCTDERLKTCFAPKTHFSSAKDVGVRGKEDTRVIDKAISKKCMIITVNKDFVGYYRDHPFRKRRNKPSFFYGLIFLRPSKLISRVEQLRRALRDIAWEETRQHDDLVFVDARGRTKHARLCHPECAKEFPADQLDWD